MAKRDWKFEVGAYARTRFGVYGKIIDRAPEPDRMKMVQVDRTNIREFEGAKPGDMVPTFTPINAYRLEFTGDNGRPESAWWQEDMLEAA